MAIKPYSADTMFNIVSVNTQDTVNNNNNNKKYAFPFEANWEKSFWDNCKPGSVIKTKMYQNQTPVAVLV